ncbi:MAG: hypothetical protein ASARMPREDX12_003761 [Alectoria sarmentosa]|nr:MAG: hypothetical protein ASARMPRED_002804 [Alectoria sarmentosa]CAD6589418.1 MAG: hypothetical protein ASARMPREDX12_003761 [Alectoria sarmentosa]
MKSLLALLAISNALARASASLDLLGAPYAAASGSSSPGAVLTLPPQPAGESLSTFLDQLFSNTTGNSSNLAGSKIKRVFANVDATGPYTNSYGLHQSCWDDDMGSGTITYNISVDFSNCGTGLKFDTDIGVYTFTNGTTTNNTNLRDMVADLYSLRHSRQSPNPNYANHTAVVAQLAIEEANQLLNNGLICQNTSGAAQTEAVVHDELRHLLANVHSYWTAVILSAAGGAAVGGSVAAITDVIFNGNVTAENVVQTAIVIGSVVIIGGILTRCDQVGRLDRAESVATAMSELVPQGREAVVQNVYVSWARRQMQRIVRQQVEEALSEAGIGSMAGSVAGSGAASPHTPGSLPSIPDSSGHGNLDSCLSELEAGQAGSAIGEMSDVTLDLEPIQEVLEQLGLRDEQGGCSPT